MPQLLEACIVTLEFFVIVVILFIPLGIAVALGRALVLEPKIMCFDEPTSALDPGLTGEVASLIKSLSINKGMSMMIITHDMDFAKKVADRIVSMKEGQLQEGLIFEEDVESAVS